ncbi:MAG: ATP-binding protein [Candidatus Dojkabacteria bacterium]
MPEELENLLIQLNPWWEKEYVFRVIPREDYLESLVTTNGGLIDILIGARRVGKTSILKSVINALLERGVSPKKILFVSCDAREVKNLGIRAVLDSYLQSNNFEFNDELYVFFDEVQEVEEWQVDVKLYYDHAAFKFYLTGSSSLILSSQTSKLTGRFKLHHVLPLSFREYMQFTGKSLGADEQKNNELVEDYLREGGYPEYVLRKDRQYLVDAIESTVYRELIDYYGLRNPAFLRTLVEYLSDKVASSVSALRIKKDLGINDQSAKFYLQYLHDVYLIFPVYKYGMSHKITRSSVPKYYFNDTGALTVSSLKPRIGLLAENAVFLHLLRKSESKQLPRIFYNVIEGVEVDFHTPKGLFEVKYRTELKPENLEKYQLLDDKVTFIVRNTDDMFYNILPQHRQIPLWKFLAEE